MEPTIREDCSKMIQFPIDIVHHILSYIESIKLRNGKYMSQISKNDTRYEMLKNIKKPRFYHCRIGNVYGLYVILNRNEQNYYKMINIELCLRSNTISYCYYHLLNKDINKLHQTYSSSSNCNYLLDKNVCSIRYNYIKFYYDFT